MYCIKIQFAHLFVWFFVWLLLTKRSNTKKMEIWKEYFWPAKKNAKCQASFENKIIMMLQLFSTPQTKSSNLFKKRSDISLFLYASFTTSLSFFLFLHYSFTILHLFLYHSYYIPLSLSPFLFLYLSTFIYLCLLCIYFSIILNISFFLKFSFLISLSLFSNLYLSFSISLSVRKTFVSDSSAAIIRNRLKVNGVIQHSVSENKTANH